MTIEKVSVHGGHSGRYCGHAQDALEDVVLEYIAQGFTWVCLTEHMPCQTEQHMPPEERAEGLTAAEFNARIDRYFNEARALKTKYAGDIELLVGFETEAYTGYQDEVSALIDRHQPDMIVGSVHHMHDILFDAASDDYAQAVERSGSIEQFYCDYFDKQLELIECFKPPVVGHFDLVRLHDPDYRARFEVPSIRDRAFRNLSRIKELGLILDLNMRSLKKSATEPYITESLMTFAIEQDIAIAPGDDSHGVADVGLNYDIGLKIYTERGGVTDWQKPIWQS